MNTSTKTARELLGGAPREYTALNVPQENREVYLIDEDDATGYTFLVYRGGGTIARLPSGEYHVIAANREKTDSDLSIVEAWFAAEYPECHYRDATPAEIRMALQLATQALRDFGAAKPGTGHYALKYGEDILSRVPA